MKELVNKPVYESIRFKYPRTPHLPWSLGINKDDVKSINTDIFVGRNVVVTEKMDGENTTLYRDHIHARSLDSRHHVSRDWVKQLHASIAHEIPSGWRVCGENLFAQHSIVYKQLDSYFYGFSIWNTKNWCLSWSDTAEWFELLGIVTPNILYRGKWDESLIKDINIDEQCVEGYVVRTDDEFQYNEFSRNVAKWVRAGHVQTDQHWMYAQVKSNSLAHVSDDSQINKDCEVLDE